jgi:hypothetical protein
MTAARLHAGDRWTMQGRVTSLTVAIPNNTSTIYLSFFLLSSFFLSFNRVQPTGVAASL